MAEDDFLFIEGLNENHPLNSQVPEAERILNEELQKIVEKRKLEGRPLKPEMQQFAEKTKDWIKDRLVERFGVPQEQVHFAQTMLAVDSMSGNNLGEQIPGASCIIIAEKKIKENIEDPDLQDYLEARVIFEELWHSTATARFKLEPRKDEPGVDITIENSGYTYNTKEGNDYIAHTAFEEGMAQVAVDEFIDDTMATEFPEGRRKFFELAKKNGADTFNTVIATQKGEKAQFGVAHQGPRELAEEVLFRGFRGQIGLLEKARITHQTVSLAREIEQIYGRGSYKKIMTATLETASEVAKELAQMRIDKQSTNASEEN